MTSIVSRHRSRGSTAGNLITLLLLVGIIGLGVYLWLGKGAKDEPTAAAPGSTATTVDKAEPDGDAPAPIEPVVGTPPLEAAARTRRRTACCKSTSASTPATAA